MSSGVHVDFVGNLTRDIELRFTTSGRVVASASVAVSRRYQSNGEWQEDTTFMNINIWGTLGENAAASLGKGMRVIVTGDLRQRSWENEQGEKRHVYEVNVESIGPDLRWAKADIERVVREQGDREPAQHSSGGGATGGPNPSWAGDEEPFVRDADIGDL